MEPQESLFETLATRRESYTHARVRAAVATADGIDRLIRGSLTFQRGDPPSNLVHHYGTVQFVDKSLDIQTADKLLNDLSTSGTSEILQLRIVRNRGPEKAHASDDDIPWTRGPFEHYWGLPSPRTSNRVHDWPSKVFSIGPKSRNQQNHQLPHGPIVVRGLPILPDVWDAITTWTGIEQNGQYDSQGSLVVILPDFRARIDKLRIGPEGAQLDIELGTLDAETIEVRASTREKPVYEVPIHREHTRARISESALPDSFLIFLTDTQQGDVVDWAIIAPYYGNDGQGSNTPHRPSNSLS